MNKETKYPSLEQAIMDRRKLEKVLEWLVSVRTDSGMSQAELARKLNCSQSRISRLENGQVDGLSVEELKAYIDACAGSDLTGDGEN